jgi:folylpolyglutamate synthase/dihydropteroate synthase
MLDGAHTLESLEVCDQWYRSIGRDSSRDVLLCAMTKGRNASAILAPLFAGQKWKNVIWIRSYNANSNLPNCLVASDLPAGIAMAAAQKPDGVLVTGSLHLVGDLLSEFRFPTV